MSTHLGTALMFTAYCPPLHISLLLLSVTFPPQQRPNLVLSPQRVRFLGLMRVEFCNTQPSILRHLYNVDLCYANQSFLPLLLKGCGCLAA